MTKFAQIFYGRSKDGYGILGASPSGRPFVGLVAALCRAVGSPDRPGDIQPFLVSKREGNSVVMIRACRGDADPTGRSTLLFHALVAPADELASSNIDAFALAEKGVFLSALPKNVEDVEVAASTSRPNSVPSGELRFPAFVASGHPLDAEVRHALGHESLSRNWATYSYRALEGFDLCVHSSYASSPVSGHRYTFANGRFTAIDDPRTVVQNSQPTFRKKESSPLLKASLLANLILVVGLVIVLVMRNGNGNKGEPPKVPSTTQADKSGKPNPAFPTEMTMEEAFEKWGKEWASEFRRKLCVAFEKRLSDNRHIRDFEKDMILLDPYYMDYKSQKATPPTPQTLGIYAALRAYVSFVETEIITTTQERNNDENDKSKR